jgi:hypothetical protein
MTIIPRLDDPSTRIYEWQLNENSTRYDAVRAWPTSDALSIKFSILATITAIVLVSSLLLIASILREAEIRRNSFNLYLLFIAVPDFIASFSCFLTCVMSAPKAEYYSEAMCGYQAFYLTFAFAANAWLNGVIMYQVHKLLRYSQHRRRYFPPRRKEVLCHAAAVYAYALFWGMLAAFNIQGMPLKSHAYYGYACFPMEADDTLTWFFYFVVMPFMLLIPCTYAFGVMFHIYWYKLMPSEGRSRNIALFLVRIVAVYFFVWLPFLLQALVGNFVTMSSWVNFTTSAISHLQALFTTVVCYYTSTDLKASMRAIMLCDRCGRNAQTDGPPPRSFFGMSSLQFRRASTGSSKLILNKRSSTKNVSKSDQNNPQDEVLGSCADPMPVLHETADEDLGVLKRMSNDMETGKQVHGSSDTWMNNSYHDDRATVSVLNAVNDGITEDFQPSEKHEEGSEHHHS